MQGVQITKRFVGGLLPENVEYFAWDRALPGFGVRIQPSGAKSYVVKYRPPGGRSAGTKRLTIGRAGALTPEEARAIAKKMLASVAHGADPAAERAASKRASTLAEVAERFLAEHVEAKRRRTTAGSYRDLLERLVLPEFGSRKADKVTTGDLARLHARLAGKPYQANRVLRVLSSLYGFAGKHHFVTRGFNPARDIERYPESSRERYLSLKELAQIGEAIREAETVGLPYSIDASKAAAKHAANEENRRTVIGPHAAAALRLLIFTGARLREILHLKWDHVDFDRGLLLLPESKTGKKTIVLNAPALTVLRTLERLGTYVIAGASSGSEGEKPRSDLKKPWRAVSKRAALPSTTRIHDLRHTHASVGAGAGLGLHIIGKLLGHSQAGTTARYAHLDIDPLRRASDEIGNRLAAAMGDVQKERDTGCGE